jgi:hypothetical protein
MSHFTVLRTHITDVESLVKALAELGFPQVEVHQTAQHLYGYQGDVRPQTAEVIIRRQFIGRASNDIGFKRQEDGTFDAIISDYDRARYHVARARLEEQGFALVTEETQQDGQIHLVLRRMV